MKLVGEDLDASDAKASALIDDIMDSGTHTFGPALKWARGCTEQTAWPPSFAWSPPTPSRVTRRSITCPTLVLDGEDDPGHASQLYEALRCQKTYHLFPAAEGGGGHCQGGVMSRLHQVVFDWLGTVLATPSWPKS